MKRYTLLIAAALLVAGCATAETLPTTTDATTTTTVAPTTTATPTTTTTTVPPTTVPMLTDTELAEIAYLVTVDKNLVGQYGDDASLLELGYMWCDSMEVAESMGLTAYEWVETVTISLLLEDDPDLLPDIMRMSGAAAGSLCADLADWTQG